MSDRRFVGRVGELPSKLRFGRFVSVGAVGAVCDNAVLLGLTAMGVLPELAKLVGAETAIVVMFAINEQWTFGDEGAPGVLPLLRRLLTSNLVRVGGVLVATGVFSALIRLVDVSFPFFGFELWYLVANGVGIVAGLFVNYAMESLFTWRVGVDS